MKTLLAMVFAVTAGTSLAQNKPLTNTYKIDPAKTKVEYVGKKVTGEHRGNVSVKSGTLSFVGEQLSGGDVVVDMNSMTNTDITDADTKGKFLGHMKSPDFFDTAKYPEAKLTVKKSTTTPKGVEVEGDLTMIGQTKPVKFLVTDMKKTDTTVTGKATVNVDRTKWGLKYGSGQFFKGLGDKMINDDFALNIDLHATK